MIKIIAHHRGIKLHHIEHLFERLGRGREDVLGG
jgi:hypothetical protein